VRGVTHSVGTVDRYKFKRANYKKGLMAYTKKHKFAKAQMSNLL